MLKLWHLQLRTYVQTGLGQVLTGLNTERGELGLSHDYGRITDIARGGGQSHDVTREAVSRITIHSR